MVVKVNQLVKRYGDLLALDHLNLEVQEGEIFGLLGPNGSGIEIQVCCFNNKYSIFGKLFFCPTKGENLRLRY